jgi:hypothetical protein
MIDLDTNVSNSPSNRGQAANGLKVHWFAEPVIAELGAHPDQGNGQPRCNKPESAAPPCQVLRWEMWSDRIMHRAPSIGDEYSAICFFFEHLKDLDHEMSIRERP